MKCDCKIVNYHYIERCVYCKRRDDSLKLLVDYAEELRSPPVNSSDVHKLVFKLGVTAALARKELE